ncbi:PAS domain S-box protein [Natronoarchaeum mannanilyticum]
MDGATGDGRRVAIDETPGTIYRRRGEDRQPIVSASDGIGDLTGHDADALAREGRGWLDLVHPDDREEVRAAVADADGEANEATYRIERANGDVRFVRDRFLAAPDDPAVIEGVALDVTETERRRRELAEDAELLEAIFEHVPIHVFVKDCEGRHVHRSDFLDFPENVIGKRDIDVDFINEESARAAYEDDMRVIEEGETVLDQEEHYPAVGEWDLTSKVPLYDEDGEVMGLLGATRRITDRKRAEQELRRKTERLDNFADVVANDIRQPLSEARRRARQIDDPDADEAHVEAAREAVRRAGAVVDDVLALSRDGELSLDPEPVSLRSVVVDAWERAGDDEDALAAPEDVELRADRSHLRRAFENLFRRGAAPVAVETTDDGFAVELAGWTDTPRERGVGDDPQAVDAGQRGDGAGLELGLVEEIVAGHGWSIRAAGGASLANPTPESPDAPGGRTRIEITGVELRETTDDTERSE